MARSHCARSGRLRAGERLHDRRVRRRVADGRVAGHGLHLAHRRPVRPAGQRALDAAMLVAERDLEVQHLLARALEAEMPGLDDAGVDRADGDLVNLAAPRRGRTPPIAGCAAVLPAAPA